MRSPLILSIVSLLIPVSAFAERPTAGQAPKKSEPSPVAPVETKQPPATLPTEPRAPKLLDLRYDEDFSYLDAPPDTRVADFFDPIKNIHVGSDWRLSIGGEGRFRMEAETNKGFGATEPAQDTFQLYRYMLHADLKYRKSVRFFIQGVHAHDEDRDLALRAVDENRGDLHQLFVDLRVLGEDNPLTLRVGRQELRYGNERYVSPLEWVNVRRRFDGVKLFSKGDTWDVDLWYAKPVVVERVEGDDFDREVDFYGAYVTYKGIKDHGIDVYFLSIDDTGNRVNPNGNAGDRNNYTLGTRFWGKTGPWDYETELAGQWGHWASDTLHAWSWAVDGGYTFKDVTWKPRVGAGFDWATGDRDSQDETVETFDQLFPLGHKYFGYLDLVGRQNIVSPNVNLSAWPIERKLQTRVAYHAFWLSNDEDALYDVGGAALRRSRFGRAGKEIGHEIDVTANWKISAHSSVLIGWSHFFANDFIQDTGVSEDADLIYVQYAFKF